MEKNENERLIALLKEIPEIEPSNAFKLGVLEKVESLENPAEITVLRPAYVLGAFAVAFLVSLLSIGIISRSSPAGQPDSAIMRWAQVKSDNRPFQGS